MQPEASGGSPAASGGADGGRGGSPAGWMTNIGFFAIAMVGFYFLMVRPQQKRQRAHDAMLGSLRRGTIVRTTGGIRGEVTEVTDRDVTLLIADRVKINVLRSNIQAVEGGTTSAGATSAAEKSA